ncbi:hypothetical protein C7451_104281 [Blastomonas natatoria]|uniref:Uncharacterized protein n=1 Tax=Blastomonas natatoria TaxID=34015 RepID=A0A2V3VCJ2_9SPHN|nr:hypothetical protein [Blastomonas natatoria]PXW77785.1 hypothetical protein C7451_104281 [Blastomonas natatoria]
MTMNAPEVDGGANDVVAQSAEQENHAARRAWSKPTLNEVDIASVTMAGGPGVSDSGILS